MGLLHEEKIQLLILEEANTDIILGRPWFAVDEPQIVWHTGDVLKWGNQCFSDCFPSLPRLSPPAKPILSLNATSIESPVDQKSVDIPEDYSHFSDVFCLKKASQLPPHRPWDCTIDLLPGESVPKGKIYPMSLPEQNAMGEYIEEALQQCYIRPSTSPAASSLFFVAKKDGGLRLCVDYRSLNNITVKFRYPLPLVPAALEHLRGATIFTKLDLRSAYNLIRIREGDEWKTAFMTPTGHFLKAEKCSFHQPSVQFLGYHTDSSGIRMDEGKVLSLWLSTEVVAFSPRPHPFLPCFAPLSRERLSLHRSPN